MSDNQIRGRYVKVTELWLKMIESLCEISDESWSGFVKACFGYVRRIAGYPDFAEHPEWLQYWMHTKFRRCDTERSKPGRLDWNTQIYPVRPYSQETLNRISREFREGQEALEEILGADEGKAREKEFEEFINKCPKEYTHE